MSENTPKIWKYRLGAFIIDLIFIFLITTLIQNINPFPVPAWIEYLIPLFSFLIYFLGLSLIKKSDYSFGKAMLNISVQYFEDSDEFDFKKLFFRILTIAIIWQLSLQELPGKLFGGDIYEVFGIVLFSIQYSFIIYNIYLAIKTGKMLQDRLTNSYVNFSPLNSNRNYSNPITENDNLFYRPIIIVGLVLFITAGSFIANQTLSNILLFEPAIKSTVENDIESLVYERAELRTRAQIWDSRTWSTDFVNDTSTDEIVLNVEIWIPAVKWNSQNRKTIINIINQNLTFDPESYDRYKLTVWCGYDELSIGKSFTGEF